MPGVEKGGLMDRVRLKTGQVVELYCCCDLGHFWVSTQEQGETSTQEQGETSTQEQGETSTHFTVDGYLLPDGYSDRCPKCLRFKWSYVPIRKEPSWQ